VYMCDLNCVFFPIFENPIVHSITVKGLKLTVCIRAVVCFRDMPLGLRVWVRFVINLVTVGDLWYQFLW